MYLNVDSTLSVASQCKLVLRAIEMEISAALWAQVAREGLYFRIIFNSEHFKAATNPFFCIVFY